MKLKTNKPYTFKKIVDSWGEVLWTNSRLGVDLCDCGLQNIFDVPEDATKIYLTLYGRPAKDRELMAGTKYAFGNYWSIGGNSPWPFVVDNALTKLFEKGVCYVGCEYE